MLKSKENSKHKMKTIFMIFHVSLKIRPDPILVFAAKDMLRLAYSWGMSHFRPIFSMVKKHLFRLKKHSRMNKIIYSNTATSSSGTPA